ncbi:hypothetical protein LX92_03916 [Maribacter polysiphoniae]|uniref:Uncharacterized protein n=1 Tax=Maribacter polysiphoniae TaxID=429344 RepID=A0A316DSZ9_9FLAO|nr:hypothetical protein LX92_03916 [Maribacter polysiphoniae]
MILKLIYKIIDFMSSALLNVVKLNLIYYFLLIVSNSLGGEYILF